MPENILGVGSTNSSTDAVLRTKLDASENEAAQTKGELNSTAKKADETGLVDIDFENMSLEEVQQTAMSLEIELLMLQTEMENLETLIKSDEKIKANYEEQYEALKKEFDKLLEDIKNEEDPNQKARLQARVSNTKSSMNMLLSQINSSIELIKTHSDAASSLQDEYAQTNYNYQNAILEQGAKQREELINKVAAQGTQSTDGTLPSNTTVSTGNSGVQNNTAASQSGASTGHISDTMLNALKNWEGLRTTAYKCPSGVWTIGYGHTGGVSAGQTITEAQAEQFLRQDLQSFENQVTNMANSAGVQLSQGQFDALVSFAYNCGGGALQKSGILGMLKEGKVDAAASKMNEYVHGGGQVLPGLVSRRKVESSWLYA